MSHNNDIEEKNDVAMVEHGEDKPRTATGAVLLESAFSAHTRFQIIKLFWKTILISMCCLWGGLADGYQFSMTASIVANEGFIEKMGTYNSATSTWAIPATRLSLWGGILSATMLIGHWGGGWMNDKYGRRAGMYAFSLCFVVGVALESAAQNWKVWLVAKTIFGFALGLVQVTCTAYVSEIAPAQVRGGLVSGYALAYALGQFFAAIGLQITQTSRPLAWRNAVLSQWVSVGIWLIALFFVPESPWHYARYRDEAKAKRAMKRLYGGISGYDLDREYAVIMAEIEHAESIAHMQSGVKVLELFQGVNLRRTIASSLPIALQQLCGVPIFFSYLTYFFQQAGIQDPFLASVIMYVLLLVGITISFWTTERIGRRPLLLWGCLLMTFANLGLGLSGSFKVTDSALHASLAMSCIWVFVYAMTAAPVAWVSASEMSTPRLKALTTAFAISTYGCLNLVWQFTTPLMLASDGANWGVKSGYLFTGLTAITGVGIYFVVPETAGRTMGELDELFELGISPRKFAQTETSAQRAGLSKARLLI